jgi:[acyl-carrier-protein] S-malonyltransferase
MKKIGFLFPGQGAQFVGMGSDFYQQAPEAKRLFDCADQILGFSLSKLCFSGPEPELIRTVNCQIAIFVTSIAILEVVRKTYPELKPAIGLGLSLGEFTALTALNSITFEDALKLVQKRAELMEKAGQNHPGTMASILGFPQESCEAVCKEAGCVCANFNSPDQIVISGTFESVEKACQLAETKGAKRAIRLKVGGAFHSPLMEDAEIGLKEALTKVAIRKPEGAFIPNVTGKPVEDPETIRALLADQLTHSVQWVTSVNTAAALDISEYVEIGPGRVLKGLVRRINSNLTVHNVEKFENLENLKILSMAQTA